MGKIDGFLTIGRENPARRPVPVRLRDWREVYEPQSDEQSRDQAARCMDCGIPFCHQGCPLGNLIPEWNDLYYKGNFSSALERLHQTNNFPEFTGRLCPAPCESACVVSISRDAVSIERTEYEIIEHGFAAGIVMPDIAPLRTGMSVAIIGSGPSGLAAAQQLARQGHDVTVFERQEAIGGLLRFGIPEFKMEKAILDRRLDQMTAEGVRFRPATTVGDDGDISITQLRSEYDAVIFAIGSTIPRDIPAPGRQLRGIYPAMAYLKPANIEAIGGSVSPIQATGKHVVILGGGDTGADCLGTAHRQGAASVTQVELLPQPTPTRPQSQPWPTMPTIYKVTSAHEEGGGREYAMRTKEFLSRDGTSLSGIVVEHLVYASDGTVTIDREEEIPAEMVFIAAGFVGPELDFLSALDRDARQHIRVDARWQVSPAEGELAPLFAAGDAVRGQSLIVWAIAEGRSVAASVHAFLTPDAPELPAPLVPYEKSWTA
ncbi:unannotated protein [freshwater metagenome]|uniref:Unannotated protein n=1 Tax=freshwater metagenome TaxID=449393 RepID=A0A6J7CI27_9ZZZZ|nr:glutamate synthase subunit beta [Actinomycetota bacterium]MUH57608.1 glutamate synthase small subunit [Actinomycetota bacterium]